ncbi:MAG: PIN domain-containing protein [Halobacteria archaeon]|nr:PIN domain-containing protein [Halobacteria archaeon]
MQQALVDTGVLYGAFQNRDQYHDKALEIVKEADRGHLPVLVALDFVIAETMNALTQEIRHDECSRAYSMVEESAGLEIKRTSNAVWDRGVIAYKKQSHLSFVDSLLYAYSRENEVEYIYSFDDGFDGLDGLSRLNTAVNPYEP